jgi:hypothetical protein
MHIINLYILQMEFCVTILKKCQWCIFWSSTITIQSIHETINISFMKMKVFKCHAVNRCTHHIATHNSCNIGRYENASCGKCVMLLSERSLKKKSWWNIWGLEKKETTYNLEDWTISVQPLTANCHIPNEFQYVTPFVYVEREANGCASTFISTP